MVRNALFLKKVSSERVKDSLLAIKKKGEREKAGPHDQENRRKSVLVQYSSTAVVEYSKKKTNNR